MSTQLFRRTIAGLAAVVMITASLATPQAASAHRSARFAVQQVDLVSDVAGRAPLTDPDLVNPWGLALGATSPLWVSNAGTGTSTVYPLPAGGTTATKAGIRVTFSGPTGAALVPTGQVANGGTGFVLTNGTISAPARFIFTTVDTGQIWAWAPGVDAARGPAEVKATVPGAAYTGLALTGDQLFAANFSQNRIDVFDSAFQPVTLPSRAFRDRSLPRGYAPFNAQAINGEIFVAYAKVDRATGRSVHRTGLGFVNRFTAAGRLVERVASRQSLNAPWGLTIAPASWGDLAGALLIGNFGDGRINVVRQRADGRFANRVSGQLRDGTTGRTLRIPGLWALLPGTAASAGVDSVWFSAGPDNETHGLLGVLRKPPV